MQTTQETMLAFLAYAIIMAASIAGYKFGIIDQSTCSLIIGGVLTHFGFVGTPTLLVQKTNGVTVTTTTTKETTPHE